MKSDPRRVLLHLAGSLDVRKTLREFPELTGEQLSEILRRSAAAVEKHAKARLNVDGGARGNPGPAGCGYVLSTGDGPLLQRGEYLGEATNNVAEYRALIAGLQAAVQMGVEELEVLADSELVVRQMTGEYRVKNQGLKPLFAQAQSLAAGIGKVSFRHIPREHNREADRLANMAIDARGPVTL